MLMMTSEALMALETAIRQAFRDGAVAYMRQVGYCIGTSFGQSLKEEGVAAGSVMEILPAATKSTGWGRLILTGDEQHWRRFVARVEGCPSCMLDRQGMPPLCDLLVGVINGLADEILESPHLVTETKCGYKTDNVCEFLVEQTSEQSEEQKYWATFVNFPWLRGRR
jgi:predicted hydrocarbon binding protein